MPRRSFLQGLAQLPLVGGSVSLIGQPTAVAEPVSRALMAQYWNWLFYERRLLCMEMANGIDCYRASARTLEQTCSGKMEGYTVARQVEELLGRNIGWVRRIYEDDIGLDLVKPLPDFHFPDVGSWGDVPKPSTRAALVLGAVDFDWRPVPR